MQHILSFNAEGFRDYEQWQHNDKSGLKKINKLIKVIQREGPLEGDGQPEVLKNTKGLYSRRIDKKNRLIYAYDSDDDTSRTLITACEGHYDHGIGDMSNAKKSLLQGNKLHI